jgi:DNA-binding winged helix-turn-helix (wHTH) protein
MTDLEQPRRYRFGVFEADLVTGELRRQGIRIRLSAQPFAVLLMFLDRPGELLTREEISRGLWPDGTFVDSEHGVNSAINRIREALRDTAGSPRFIETLARRGYRFIAPVEQIPARQKASNPAPGDQDQASSAPESSLEPSPSISSGQSIAATEIRFRDRILASPEELPHASYPVVRTLFVLLQLMYVGFYTGALANLPEIADLVSALPKATHALLVLIVTAGILIPVRAFLLAAVFFRAPGLREKFLRLWPFLLPLDVLWSLSPFLLLHHISFGLALACTALLAWSPFAQRSLVLMGAVITSQPIRQPDSEQRSPDQRSPEQLSPNLNRSEQ